MGWVGGTAACMNYPAPVLLR